MKIGIIGMGVVGRAIYDGLLQIGNELAYYDISCTGSTIDNVIDSDIIFVCVPTPSMPNGKCDTSIVVDVTETLAKLNFKGIVAIKSTVIPGTTQNLIDQYPDLMICFVPEFLREKSALSDFIGNHDILIVGTENAYIYENILKSHGNIPKSSIQIPPTEAEISKYFVNSFNALRVVFANGMFELCEALNADYQQVFQAVSHKNTVLPDYLRCSKYLRGFDGNCLPKDLQALAALIHELNLDIRLFDATIADNKNYTK